MTIKDLVTTSSTLEALDILARADRLLWPVGGRYYGGQLTEKAIEYLRPLREEK